MTEYNNGKIYGIYFKEDTLTYIGSTILELNQRMNLHRYDAKRKKTNFYNFYNENDRNDFSIKLIENYSCNTKQELLLREAETQKLFPDTYNSRLPILNEEEKKESKMKTKEYMDIYNKEYRQKNLEQIRKNDLIRKKKYIEDPENKKKRNEIQLRSKLKNKYTIHCECGAVVTNLSLWLHKKSKKHVNFISQKV
jgi:hypothetical protein